MFDWRSCGMYILEWYGRCGRIRSIASASTVASMIETPNGVRSAKSPRKPSEVERRLPRRRVRGRTTPYWQGIWTIGGEASKVPNFANFDRQNLTVASSNFGKINSSFNRPRVRQLAARISNGT